LHGQDKDALAKTQKGNWRYDIVEAGYKCNMTDIMAVIGQVELERYDSDTLPRRKIICEKYSEVLSQYEWAQLPVLKNNESEGCYHLYPLRIKNITEVQRDAIIKEIFDHDVSVNVHFIPVPMMSFYSKMGYNVHNYPVTFDNYSREISLPIFYDLDDEMVDQVVNAVIQSVKKVIG
jgi:dTDP-4-amino-4,6-dideoxygalactose transaminase